MSVQALMAFADEALAGLAHRRVDFDLVAAAEPLRAGVQIVCSTDAHSLRGLGNMTLSVATARRGWATATAVLNTRSLRSVLRERSG